MKKLSLIFLLATMVAKSQTDDENHRKYWYYRTRLRNDFTVVGTGPGNSFVFNQRGVHPSSNGGNGFQGNFQDGSFIALNEGDGTSTLGYYLGVLATEYRMLINNGQDDTKVNHELFCALNALNRVDYTAEISYGKPGNTNGFFLRDDIPSSFAINNYASLNYYNNGVDYSSNPVYPIYQQADRGFCSIMPNGMSAVNSSGSATTNLSVESQDQVYDLIFGLGLIASLVDQSASDKGANFNNPANYCYGTPGVSSLKQEAQNITARLINYVKNSNGHGNGLNSVWKIYDPNGILVSNNGGEDLSYYAYPLSQAGCFIMSGSNPPAVTAEVAPHSCATNDPNGFTDHLDYNLTPGYSQFHVLADDNGQGGTKDDLEGYYNNLGAVCNCYYQPVGLAQANPAVYQTLVVALGLLEDIVNSFVCYFGCPGWLQTAIDNIISSMALTMNINDTGSKLYLNESSLPILLHTQGVYDLTSAHPANGTKMYHGSYAHAIMHGDIWTHSLDGTMRSLINEAPCGGTYNFPPTGGSTITGWGGNSAEWSSDNRCDWTARIGEVAESNPNFPTGGEFNGLDYMLYHNLYYLYNTNYSSVDLSDRIVHFPFPISGSLNNTMGLSVLPSYDNNTANGSQATPATVGSFETIVADNVINSTANVGYRAGKTIHLISSGGSQQFHVIPGADFHAYIQTFNCSSGDYQRIASTNTNTQPVEMYPSAAMFEQATHGTGPVEWHPPVPESTTEAITAITSSYTSKLNSINAMISAYTKDEVPTSIDVFPNPSTGKIILKNTTANYTYTINDVLGNVILNGQVSNNTCDVDLSGYEKGIYFVRFDNGTGNTQTKKVIIN